MYNDFSFLSRVPHQTERNLAQKKSPRIQLFTILNFVRCRFMEKTNYIFLISSFWTSLWQFFGKKSFSGLGLIRHGKANGTVCTTSSGESTWRRPLLLRLPLEELAHNAGPKPFFLTIQGNISIQLYEHIDFHTHLRAPSDNPSLLFSITTDWLVRWDSERTTRKEICQPSR